MKPKLKHFAMYTDNIDRAKNFYEQVFNWGFNSYGPSDFMQMTDDRSGKGKLIGAIQSRKYAPIEEKIIGAECTIEVDKVDDIIKKVKSNGGKIVMPKTAIPSVGWITKFLDSEGNLMCAMETDENAQ